MHDPLTGYRNIDAQHMGCGPFRPVVVRELLLASLAAQLAVRASSCARIAKDDAVRGDAVLVEDLLSMESALRAMVERLRMAEVGS